MKDDYNFFKDFDKLWLLLHQNICKKKKRNLEKINPKQKPEM